MTTFEFHGDQLAYVAACIGRENTNSVPSMNLDAVGLLERMLNTMTAAERSKCAEIYMRLTFSESPHTHDKHFLETWSV